MAAARRFHEVDGVGDSPESDPMMAGIGSAYVAGFQDYTRRELGLVRPEEFVYHF